MSPNLAIVNQILPIDVKPEDFNLFLEMHFYSQSDMDLSLTPSCLLRSFSLKTLKNTEYIRFLAVPHGLLSTSCCIWQSFSLWQNGSIFYKLNFSYALYIFLMTHFFHICCYTSSETWSISILQVIEDYTLTTPLSVRWYP